MLLGRPDELDEAYLLPINLALVELVHLESQLPCGKRLGEATELGLQDHDIRAEVGAPSNRLRGRIIRRKRRLIRFVKCSAAIALHFEHRQELPPKLAQRFPRVLGTFHITFSELCI